MTLKCASFFAGVGGIDQGFEATKAFKTIYANEFDEHPAKTFELNHDIKVDVRDIREVKADELPQFDVMLAGFPCQPFSIAGKRQGFKDEQGRGNLFFELVRIIHHRQPSIVVLENVKNLATHNGGDTLKVIIEALEREHYYVKHAIQNAMVHGNVPQNRERIYIVAFKDANACDRFEFPAPVKLTAPLSSIIDFDSKVEDKHYYTEGRFKGDIYDKLIEAVNDPNAVYQWRRKYVRKNQSGVVPTLTANQGSGGHNVCIIKTAHGLRRMTPRECFNAQGFPKDYNLPSDMADSRLYKQAGNSVCVPVLQRIAEQIIKAIEV